jgi:MtN3 and saliva related transmembrane protein
VTYSLLLTGLLLWVTYGCMRNDWPIIICNAFSALFCGIVLWLKLVSRQTVIDIHNKIHNKDQ